jgi:hypothetical protein
MKLFNKTIDRELFKQYALGSDLAKQNVVVKIFNPVANGTWFILNSDPNDPDYLWAIVDLGYGAEVGSVSRSDLETYRGRFGMGFERDLSFDPINAEELYNGLRQGKYYADGGQIEVVYERRADFKKKPIKLLLLNKGKEQKGYTFSGKDQVAVLDNYNRNKQEDLEKLWNLKGYESNYANGGNISDFTDNQQMIMNQNVELEHHHEELEDILKDEMPVPAWVVAKMATATQSISDVTHYLDGEKELMEDEMEDENEEEGEEEDEEEDEIKDKEVVEPINVSAGTKAEITKKFTDDALGNLKGFLKGMEGIELRDDYTFDYKNEQFEIEPIINSDENGVSNAVFTVFDGDGEEQGEVAYSREGGKQKFTANSDFFGWDRAKFEDGGFMNGVYANGGYFDGTIPKVSTYMTNYANGGEIAKAEIFGLSRNYMGTTDIEMKITGMRKAQDFSVYPIGKEDAGNVIMIQSETRIGQINLVKGVGVMSQSHSSGAYFVHLQMDKLTPFTISESDLENIKAQIFKTAGSNVGTRGIVTDNSGASGVYAKGGVTYFNDENQYRLGRPSGSFEKEIYAKVKDRIDSDSFVGSFGWKILSNKKSNIADGFLYKLDDYDQNLIKNLNLKQGEKVFRYVNRTTAIGGMMPFIKINIEKALLYFPVSNDNDDIIFETRGVTPLWINLIQGSFADGGEITNETYEKRLQYLKIMKNNQRTDLGKYRIDKEIREINAILEHRGNLKSSYAHGGNIKLGDVVEVKQPNYGYDSQYYVVNNKAGYDKDGFLISETSKRLGDVFEEDQLHKVYAKGGGVDMKYYVIDVKYGKVVSKGFDTEEEAKVEKFEIFEKTNNFFLSQKKMSKNEADELSEKQYAKGGGIENDGYNLKDINGKKIEVGDTVKTTQPSGGLLNPANAETGVVEKTKDAFGQESLQIRYRKQGTNYDRFILLNGKINEIVDKSSSSFEQGGFMDNIYADGGQIRVGDKFKGNWSDSKGNNGYSIYEVVKQNVTSSKDYKTKVMVVKVIESSDPSLVGQLNEEYKPNFKKLINYGIYQLLQEGKPKMTDEEYAKGGNISYQNSNYQLLDRLRSDCDYYLGNGNRSEKHLWAGNVDAQIKKMKELWNGFPKDAKPEWLSMNDILSYENKMKSQYADGGSTKEYADKKYILKADIKTVTVKRNGKEVTYKGADVLNGANVLAKGGDLTTKANYVAKRDVVSVELKNGSKIKPINGYWVKKGAEPIEAEPTSTSSGKSEPKMDTTQIRKDARGNWRAETNIDNFNGYDFRISTVKTYSGNLVSSAQGGKTEATGTKGIVMFKYTMYQDPNYTLEVSKPKRLTDKVVTEQHDKALAKFKKFMETGTFKGGGKISNFDKLSDKVAKQYEGKPVKSQFQEEYGKYYSKEEAQEVGDKVAGKVKAMQTDSKAFGGLFKNVKNITKPKPKYPNLEGKQVPLKTGEFVMVFTQDNNTLSVINVGKIGSGVKQRKIDISEVNLDNFEAGGQTGTKQKNNGTENLKRANDLTKKIRMEGESYLDAKRRAFAILKKENQA